MTRELLNRAEALDVLHSIALEDLPSVVAQNIRDVTEALGRDSHIPGVYIPRDPAVSILLSHITSGRSLQQALTTISAAHPPYAFPANRAPRVGIKDHARLILAGDWGSGVQRALNVSSQIHSRIVEGLSQGKEIHVISLGDVYYSGLAFEYHERFLSDWPVAPFESGTVCSWVLNGNHDMYAGGRAFFETLLADPRFAAQNGSSYFLLENTHWQIAGLDTAYAPPDESGSHANLHGNQAEWLRQRRDVDKRTVLLSHHPLFSVFGSTGPLLERALKPIFTQCPIDAWFWGHEHYCAVYRDASGPVRFASLVGHGGISMPPKALLNSDKPLVYYYCDEYSPGLTYLGFAQIDLDGPMAKVRYYNERGACHHEEAL